MKVFKHRIWIVIGVVLLSFIAFSTYNYVLITPAVPVDAVPDNAGLVLYTGKPLKIWQKLKDDNNVWESLRKNPEFGHLDQAINAIDSILSRHIDPEDFFSNRNITISLHHLPGGKKDFLFVSETTPVVENLIVSRLLGNIKGKGAEVPAELKKYRKIRISRPVPDGALLYYTFRRGLFMATYSPELLGMAIDKLYAKAGTNPLSDLKAALSKAGPSNDATLLVNFNQLPDLVMGFSAPGFTPGFTRVRYFARYAVFDVYFQKQKIQLSGYTLAGATDFLRLFKNQEAMQPSALNLLPDASVSFIYLSFSDFSSFVGSYNNYLAKIRGGDPARMLSVSIMENLKEVGLSEIAVALVNAEHDRPVDNTLVVVKSSAPGRLSAMLNETLASGNDQQTFTLNQRVYRMVDFKRIFGPFLYNVFPEFDKACYINLDDYFLFASTPEILQQYVTTYLAGKTLPRKPSFRALMQMTESRSNIWIYYNPAESVAFHHFLFSDKIAGTLDANLGALSDFDALSLQFSGHGSMNYTSAIIKHRNAEEENLPLAQSYQPTPDTGKATTGAPAQTLWEATLNEEFASAPYLFNGFPGNTSSVGVYGASGAIYLFDAQGHSLWKTSFLEKPISPPVVVNVAGRKALLICSNKRIYCLGIDGKLLKNYPVSLPVEAATAPSLVFSELGGEPRLLYASVDSLLRAVDLKGKTVSGWKNPHLPSLDLLPIRSFSGQSGKTLILPFRNGDVLMFTADGRRIPQSGQAFTNSTFSEFYVNETNRKGQLLTTDARGNLVYINSSGPIEKTVFDNFSESHFFIYADFNNDRDPDFIFADARKLVVYDRFKKVMLQHTFSEAVAEKPVLLEIPGKGNLLIVKTVDNQVFVFDKSGRVTQQALPGGTLYSAAGVLSQSGTSHYPVWISVKGNRLWVSKLSE
ncbi:MAG: hypothetical protein ACP5O2_00905 [Bacteroidales bacterium]